MSKDSMLLFVKMLFVNDVKWVEYKQGDKHVYILAQTETVFFRGCWKSCDVNNVTSLCQCNV